MSNHFSLFYIPIRETEILLYLRNTEKVITIKFYSPVYIILRKYIQGGSQIQASIFFFTTAEEMKGMFFISAFINLER